MSDSGYVTQNPQEYSPMEEALAAKLFTSFKKEMEAQGRPYAYWDTLESKIKKAWLQTAREHLAVITGLNLPS